LIEVRMSERTIIALSVFINLVITSVALAVFGWNAVGAHASARYTARFSACAFVFAFAHPGLIRWFRSLPSYASLIHAFVGAHCVHFAAVALTIALDLDHDLRKSPGPAAAVVGVGFSLVILTGLTVSASSKLYRVLHSLTVYAVFAIFLLGYVKHPLHPFRSVAVALIVSLALRISGKFPSMKARYASAGQ
jgi:hypothetical protein